MAWYSVELLFLVSPFLTVSFVRLQYIYLLCCIWLCICTSGVFINSHGGLDFRGSVAQTASGDFVVRALGSFHLEREPHFGVCDPEGSFLVAERGFPQALPSIGVAIGLLGGRGSVLAPRGLLLCCMALSASEVYHLTVDGLRQVCAERGLYSGGPVRVLRQRLADHIKSNPMDTPSGEGVIQASVPTDLRQVVIDPNSGFGSHGGGSDASTPSL